MADFNVRWMRMQVERRLQHYFPLAPHTSMQVGGAARYFLDIFEVPQLLAALAWAKHMAVPVQLLGAGSNVVVADAGFAGLVLRLRMAHVHRHHQDVAIDAGVLLADVVESMCAQGYYGMECLAGIPGCIGAACVQNVGAYGQSMADVVHSVEVVDIASGRWMLLGHQACRFAYRQSVFQSYPTWWIVRVHLRWQTYPTLRYAQLPTAIKPWLDHDSSQARRQAVITLRRSKGMLAGQWRSCGSFFKNPFVSQVKAWQLQQRYPQLPVYPAGAGLAKLPAAYLIEQAGFRKGYRCGPVGLSPQHALALVNVGGGSAQQIFKLGQKITQAVQAMFGVLLVIEPQRIG